MADETTSSGRRRSRRSFFTFFLREGSVVVLAIVLALFIWGPYEPQIGLGDPPFTGNDGIWLVFTMAVVAMVYTALQALAAVTQPLGRETSSLIDFLVSILPLLVVIYALIEWLRKDEFSLTTFEHMAIVIAGLAVLIDIVVFTWISLRINKLANEFVRMN